MGCVFCLIAIDDFQIVVLIGLVQLFVVQLVPVQFWPAQKVGLTVFRWGNCRHTNHIRYTEQCLRCPLGLVVVCQQG